MATMPGRGVLSMVFNAPISRFATLAASIAAWPNLLLSGFNRSVQIAVLASRLAWSVCAGGLAGRVGVDAAGTRRARRQHPPLRMPSDISTAVWKSARSQHGQQQP